MSDLQAITQTRNGVWSEQQLEYLLSNAGFFQVNDIAETLGKGIAATRKKISSLGLSHVFQGLPACLDDLQCIPDGMTVQKTSKGKIYRVPSSTPGIVSRTVHSAWANEKDEDE